VHHVGSNNGLSGITVLDDTLPHQIRLIRWGEQTRVTCVCLTRQQPTRYLATIDPSDDPWPAYDRHTADV
jgi:hypothetical protein